MYVSKTCYVPGESGVNASQDDSTPLSTPPSATHDTSRASFHVKDLEQFASELQNASLPQPQP